MKTLKTSLESSGTYLQGYMKASYEDLIKVFGEPTYGPNSTDIDKSTCEWVLEYGDNQYCTIYDWKLDETPYYAYNWHIGGFNKDCVKAIEDYFKGNI